MKSKLLALSFLFAAGCASNEAQVRQALEKNPNLIFEVIEKHPEEFISSVNKAAQAARQKEQEKQFAQMKQQQENDVKNPKNPAIEKDRILSGDAAAPITIVEYSDFQCPYCSMAYSNLKSFKKKYEGKVRFIYKNMPLNIHPMAMPAALYFEAVRLQGVEKARKFHDYVFENQRGLKDDSFLQKAAKEAGADLKKLAADLKKPELKEQIEKDSAEFEKFGFTGTPVIILNGVALEGAQPVDELERVLKLTSTK